MMFMYVAFAPILIALAAGALLFVWSQKKDSGFGKAVGMLIFLCALILVVLQAMHTSKMWRDGFMMKKEMREMMHQMPEEPPKPAPAK